MGNKKVTHTTQRQDVLAYLEEHGSITQMQAYKVFDAPITRLSSVIFDLKKLGKDIETVDIIGKNCYGTYRCAKYVLHK